MHSVKEAHTQNEPKEKHSETHTNKAEKKKYKEKNIKSNKGKATNNIQRNPHKGNSWSFHRDSESQKGVARYSQDDEGEEYRTKNVIPRKAVIQI